MSFPLDAVNQMLERLAAHSFYANRLPSAVSGAAEFAGTVPLMTRSDLTAEMEKPGYGAFGDAKPVRMNLSPMGASLVPAMQSAGDITNLVAACRTHLDACGITENDVCAVTFGFASPNAP